MKQQQNRSLADIDVREPHALPVAEQGVEREVYEGHRSRRARWQAGAAQAPIS